MSWVYIAPGGGYPTPLGDPRPLNENRISQKEGELLRQISDYSIHDFLTW